MQKIFSILLCLLLPTLFLTAANDVYFRHLGEDEGLSQMSVSDIYQDGQGAMWFATRQGATRYNGNTTETFCAVPHDTTSLAANVVKGVCGDGDGLVFMLASCINKYDLRTRTMNRISQKQVEAFAYGNGFLWFTEKNILYAYVIETSQIVSVAALPDGEIANVMTFCNDKLYIGTVAGHLFVFAEQKIQFVQQLGSEVTCIYMDGFQNLWVGTWYNGLFKISRSGIVNYRKINGLSSDFVRAVCEDDEQNLWIGTMNGLDKFNVTNGTFVHYVGGSPDSRTNLMNESVWALRKDRQGSIWIGSYFGGIDYFNPTINCFKMLSLGSVVKERHFPIINSIVELDDGDYILCTEGDGLWIYSPQMRSCKIFTADIRNPNALPSNNIKTFYYDKQNGYLYLGLHLGGLCRFNVRSKTFKRYKMPYPEQSRNNVVRSIIPYGDSLLVGTYFGVYTVNLKTEKFTLLMDRIEDVTPLTDMKLDKHGNLWVVGYGLHRLNLTTLQSESFYYDEHTTGSLNCNAIEKIQIDYNGYIWLGTNGGGVNGYDPETRRFTYINQQTCGLQNDFVSNIFFTPLGYLLITTTHGFSLYDVSNHLVTNFDMENGFPLNSLFNGGACITAANEIMLAGMNGLVSFREKDLAIQQKPIHIVFSRLFVNDAEVLPDRTSNLLKQALPYTQSITLNHKQNIVSVEICTDNFLTENGHQLRYKLDGFSDAWLSLSEKTNLLRFMNLPAGKYTLHVQAVSTANQRLITEQKLKIRIKPPFYFTIWAYLCYALAAALLIWWYMRFLKSKLNLRASLEYEQKAKAHLEEVNQSKLRFFTNISHEFRTPLTLIVGQVDMLLQKPDIPPAIYNRILNIRRNTLNMQNLITELLEFRKVEQGHLTLKVCETDMVAFLYEIYLSFSEYAYSRNIHIQFDGPDVPLHLWFDPIQMQKVFYNLISNAFKYTPQGGNIRISIEEFADYALVKVADSGIGISQEALSKIFDRFYQAENGIQLSNLAPGTGIGLALTKGIVEAHGAAISVESEPHVGTNFIVRIPKGSMQYSEEQKIKITDVDKLCIKQLLEADGGFVREMADNTHTADNKKPQMLIVEDNAELRKMLVQVFEPIYAILEASDGEEGLAKTIENQPDIVLSDLMMPKMSGSEMCAKIKGSIETCHIPVVLLTAQTAPECTIEGLRMGADDYITKPFNIRVVVMRCNNLLNNRKLLQEKFSRQTEFKPDMLATNQLDQQFMEKTYRLIEDNLDNSEFDITMFAREIGLGRTKLFAKIKGITGMTPNDFILSLRLKKAAALLLNNPEMNISDITYALGFSSPKYFAKCFKKQFGKAPTEYRKEK